MIKPPRMLNDKRSSPWQSVVAVVFLLLAAFLLFDLYYIGNYFVVQVSGGSMEDTLYSGDIILADRYKQPERGDIVIIDVSNYGEFGFQGSYIIKRLIAVEGDTVKCNGRALFLRKAGTSDFVLLEEPYTNYTTNDFDEVTVGEGEIFFLGDHRTNSMDSREVGCLKRSDIVGVVPEWAVSYRELIGVLHRTRERLFGIH